MRRIFLLLVLLLLLYIPGSTYAVGGFLQTTKTGSAAATRETIKTQIEADRVTDLKKRATTEITRRINFLKELSNKIDRIKKLSDADKTNLKTQIQAQIDSLNVLQAKINSDTDLATLKADVKSIITDYYIFAFFRVKISLLVAADRLSVTADTMNTVYTKLQARVEEAKASGKDVTSLEALLSDMLSKINGAKSKYQAAEDELNSLTAAGYPGNKSSLFDARTKLKLGAQDLRAAYKDAVKIRQGLGDISGNLKKGTFYTNTNKISTPSGNQ